MNEHSIYSREFWASPAGTIAFHFAEAMKEREPDAFKRWNEAVWFGRKVAEYLRVDAGVHNGAMPKHETYPDIC